MLDVLKSTGRLHRNSTEHFAEPFGLLDEMFQMMIAESHGDVDAALTRLSYDASDGVHMAIQACAVLNCANVEAGDLAPGKGANAKRVASGKSPFFTYKVLQLAAGKAATGEKGSGSHSAPRTHLRRGHIRRLENKVTWVRPAIVNAGTDRGTVAKDYQLGGRESSFVVQPISPVQQRGCAPTLLNINLSRKEKPARLSGLNPYRWTWRRQGQYKPLSLICKAILQSRSPTSSAWFRAQGLRLR